MVGSRQRPPDLGADGWTLHSADGSNTAHSEHTIAITTEGARILTRAGAGAG
jgi:methionyl aminopeptidase